ncbi:MAG: mechanosensitive ion channel domain-containing protein [Nanoarchaeota archaeon]
MIKEVLDAVLSSAVLAVVYFLMGVVIAKLAERIIEWVLHELEVDNWLKKAGLKFAFEQSIAALVKYVIYAVTIILVLDQLRITAPVLNIVAYGIGLLVLAGILLGFKDFVPNFVAGISIHRRGFVKEGDQIRVRDIEGEVRSVNLLDTRIKTSTGDIIFVPNAIMVKNEVMRVNRKKTMLKQN